MKNLVAFLSSRRVSSCSSVKYSLAGSSGHGIFTVGVTRGFIAVATVTLSLMLVCSSQVFAAEKPEPQQEHVSQEGMSKVNINHANIEDLKRLKGVGEKKAIAIVQYREEHGNFETLEQLAEVKGISVAIIEKNRAHLVW